MAAAAGIAFALAVASCSSGGSGGGSDASDGAAVAPQPALNGAAGEGKDPQDYAFGSAADSGGLPVDGVDVGGSAAHGSAQAVVTSQAALIRTAEIELQSDSIQSVVDRVDGYALTSGGTVDSEDTSTSSSGEVNHARIEVRVPVARFQDAYDHLSGLGDLVHRSSSTQDVTARVADVSSRVDSARASIAQLRGLYTRATSLGLVIRLERELSSREADLESLQAQQRSLNAQTTMSTLLVTVTLPPKVTPPPPSTDHDQAGFVSGIKKGWDALVTFVVGSSHALGLVLPLGVLAIIAGLIARPLVRRFTPRGPGEPQPSE